MDLWTPKHFCEGRKVLNHKAVLLCKKTKPVSPFPYPLSILASARKQKIAFTIKKILPLPSPRAVKSSLQRHKNQRCLLHVTGWSLLRSSRQRALESILQYLGAFHGALEVRHLSDESELQKSESLLSVHNFYATNYIMIKTPTECATCENVNAYNHFSRLITGG